MQKLLLLAILGLGLVVRAQPASAGGARGKGKSARPALGLFKSYAIGFKSKRKLARMSAARKGLPRTPAQQLTADAAARLADRNTRLPAGQMEVLVVGSAGFLDGHVVLKPDGTFAVAELRDPLISKDPATGLPMFNEKPSYRLRRVSAGAIADGERDLAIAREVFGGRAARSVMSQVGARLWSFSRSGKGHTILVVD